jgi:peptide/nickel transport system substrate-binding protein
MRCLIAAAAVIVLSLTVQQAAAQTFSFQNESTYVDETHIMHVLGEVKNDSPAAVKDVIITAAFYDKSGKLLTQNQTPSKLRVINTGQVAPFDIPYYDTATVDKVGDYKLSAAGQSADKKSLGIRILSSQSRLDVLGVYYINVEARNDGSDIATNPGIVATLYDKDGRVVAIGEALAEGGGKVTEMAPGQEAGFGIAVAERLQTYKAVRYTLVADSDQYLSNIVASQAAGLGANANNNYTNNTKSGCLIATAAFGSELAPQVQQLRTFRDGIALKTLAGSSFMSVFNTWYYSFSPSVADYERQQPWLQATVKTAIYPLLGILDLSAGVYDLAGREGEAGIVGAGLAASSLIGLLYFAPVSSALIVADRRKRWDLARAKYVLVGAWAASLIAVVAGELFASTDVLMFGTALLVMSTISTVILALVRIVRL